MGDTPKPALDLPEEDRPAEALTACKDALHAAEVEIDAIQQSHRERWVQHHLFMRKTSAWEEEVYQRIRHLRDAFSSVANNIKRALPSRKRKTSATTSPAEQVPEGSSTTQPDQPGPSQQRDQAASVSSEPRSSPGSDVCLSEEQLDACANAVLNEFEESYSGPL